MKRLAAVLILPLASLVGCAPIALEAESSRPPAEARPSPVDEPPAYECLDVSPATIAGLQWGIDDKQAGLVVTAARAIVNPAEGTASWFVAGKIEGPGMGDDSVGVWHTIQDPTTAEGDSIAFVSVDAMAAEFSGYVQPANFSSALAGVGDVRACLD